MPAAPAQTPPSSNLRAAWARFWRRVSEGQQINQLWSQLQKDARSSYRFYSADLEERSSGQTRLQHIWAVTRTLFWAILEKLTPARRVLLLLGMVLLVFPAGGFTYTNRAGHVEVFELDLHVCGALLIFIVLLLELADRVTMKRDLEIAQDIQTWLLPGAPLQLPGYEIAYATRPANTVAGDYYDVILRPGASASEGRILFVVADVAGKSIPAAMLMATFQASLRTLCDTQAPLEQILQSLNRYECTNSQGGAKFTTAFFAELDPATGAIRYVNAGHNAPMLKRTSGAQERLEIGGLPLGIFPDASYSAGAMRLENGDWLVVFTDGVVEALNSYGDEYGEERVNGVFNGVLAIAPAEMLHRLLVSLDAFAANTPQHDDMTCLMLKRKAA
jgi:serine phosphatase RsbU (regulator of sigma subunit)